MVPAGPAAVPGERRVPCPCCGVLVPEDPGWTAWCECGWNLDPRSAPERRGLLARVYAEAGRRHGEALFARIAARGPTRPVVTLASLLVGILSALVIAGWLSLRVLAVVVLVVGGATVVAIFAALVLFLIAWVLRPRLWRVERRWVVSPDGHPRLHRLVEDVARAVGVPAPEVLAVLPEDNAAAARTGWRGRRTVALGAPIVFGRGPDECVAVLAHELAHFGNGDVTRGTVVGVALAMLDGWCEVLTPRSLFESDRSLMGAAGVLLLRLLALLPQGVLSLLAYLSWRQSQIAEYYADRSGAAVSGTDAFVALLERRLDDTAVERALHAVVVAGSTRPLFAEVRHQQQLVPARERERLRRVAQRSTAVLDATHPPLGVRLRMLRTQDPQPPLVRLSNADLAAIRAELADLEGKAARAMVDAYRTEHDLA